jgi:hypothetical protein
VSRSPLNAALDAETSAAPACSRSAWGLPLLLRGLALGLVCVLGLAASAPRAAGSSEIDEYKVKAAFLYNFAQYVEWPSERFKDKQAPIVLGVLGKDPFGKQLDETFKGKKIGERGFEVVRVKSAAEASTCHMLFVPASDAALLRDLLKECAGKSVLLVGESTDFSASGGCVNFYLDAGKVRFEINVDAAKRSKLEVSSKLLKVARLVKDKEAP